MSNSPFRPSSDYFTPDEDFTLEHSPRLEIDKTCNVMVNVEAADSAHLAAKDYATREPNYNSSNHAANDSKHAAREPNGNHVGADNSD